MYTQEQIEQWKAKAEKWDALEAEVLSFYGGCTDQETQDADLLEVGAMCVHAFGFTLT